MVYAEGKALQIPHPICSHPTPHQSHIEQIKSNNRQHSLLQPPFPHLLTVRVGNICYIWSWVEPESVGKFVSHSFLNLFPVWIWISRGGVTLSHSTGLLSTSILPKHLSKANAKLMCFWVQSISTSKIDRDFFRMFSFPASQTNPSPCPFCLPVGLIWLSLRNGHQVYLLCIHPTWPPLWGDHVVAWVLTNLCISLAFPISLPSEAKHCFSFSWQQRPAQFRPIRS